MALIDYKIARITRDNRHVEAVINIYRGSYQDVTRTDIFGNTTTVNKYVRAARVAQRRLAYDVTRDMTKDEFLQKARAYLNSKLLAFADKNRHTVIAPQQDVTKLEAVSNEQEP